MIKKFFGKDFFSEGGALTLASSDVKYYTRFGDWEKGVTYSAFHPSTQWTISGEIHENYYAWVNDFEASHPHFGVVKGNFEGTVEASSEEAFQNFWNNHTPNAWDCRVI